MTSGDINDRIACAFKKAWPNGDTSIYDYLTPMIMNFANSDCSDKNYLEELENGCHAKFIARIWEAMLYGRFTEAGWCVSGTGSGPDFLLTKDENNVIVEAVSLQPGKSDLLKEYIYKPVGSASRIPVDEMLLRWTSVLRSKKDKYLRDIECERVKPDLPFIIAVNAARLDADPCGVNGLPLAVMAVLPFGHLNIETGEAINGTHIGWRSEITNQNGAPINTDNFLNEDYSCVSALIGCSGFYADDPDKEKFCGQPPYFLIHNPKANNPLPRPWLRGAIEYHVTEFTNDYIELVQL